MFTGIIEAVGHISDVKQVGGDIRLRVVASDFDWSDVKLGDSIATNGVCLTAVELDGPSFVADVSCETIEHTTIAFWQNKQTVNLEKALMPQSRLGGHMVSGHVDGVGEVLERRKEARSDRFVIRTPKTLAKYIARKGSITVDGTSLTVNDVDDDTFELNIVPHTLKHTIIGTYAESTAVNLEVDIIARYLERLLQGEQSHQQPVSMTQQFLAENGYLK